MNLADNSLSDLETKVFQMLTKLKILDLSRNPLEDLQPDIFKDIIVSVTFTYPFPFSVLDHDFDVLQVISQTSSSFFFLFLLFNSLEQIISNEKNPLNMNE